MSLAAYIGMSITEFWGCTPAELFCYAEAFQKREAEKVERQQKLMIYQAYLISRWVWQKRIDIDRIIRSGAKNEDMTDAQMLARVKSLNTVLGGEVDGGK